VHYIRYCILVQNNKRDLLLKELEKGGIEASAIYPEVRPDPEKFPGAFVVSDQILTLPCHPGINDRDLNKIVHIIRTFA
jgi:dTDP-4-amino-4,6-dideoxygalactose transaminase